MGPWFERFARPAAWQATSGDASTPAFAGEDGTLQIMVDGAARYLPGDAEILAKAYVNRAHYKLISLAPGKLDTRTADAKARWSLGGFCTK